MPALGTISASAFTGAPALIGIGLRVLSTPFDALRHQYAVVVTLGLAPRSLVASARYERLLDAMEHATLGPLARRV